MNNYFNTSLICIFILLLFTTNCTISDNKTAADIGKKIVHIEQQFVQTPPDFDTLVLSSKTEFNRQGEPIEKFQYSKYNYSMIIHTKWAYDDHNNISSKSIDNKEAGKVFQESYTYEYDKTGKKVKMVEYNSDNTTGIEHNYFYNNDGSYTDTVKSNSQIQLIMEYNENDKIIRGKNFQQESSIKNEVDEFGNYTKRIVTYTDGPPNLVTYTNEYDSIGNLIRKILDHRYRAYEYNENRDIIKETRFNGDQPTLIISYVYQYFE